MGKVDLYADLPDPYALRAELIHAAEPLLTRLAFVLALASLPLTFVSVASGVGFVAAAILVRVYVLALKLRFCRGC